MDDIFKFLTLAFATVALAIQLLAICFMGSRLSAESNGITHSIYTSKWIDRNEKYKRVMCIMVERSMHPITIRAGGLFEVSLPTFVKVWMELNTTIVCIFPLIILHFPVDHQINLYISQFAAYDGSKILMHFIGLN